jgi:hypothetical protein
MLSGYISGLEAYHKQSTINKEKQGCHDRWNQALKSAEDALAMFRKAGDEHQAHSVVHSANTIGEALLMLKDR